MSVVFSDLSKYLRCITLQKHFVYSMRDDLSRPHPHLVCAGDPHMHVLRVSIGSSQAPLQAEQSIWFEDNSSFGFALYTSR